MSDNKDKSGADLIAEERYRQIVEEGYSAALDDQYTHNELMWTADAYTQPGLNSTSRSPTYWPWEEKYWKPSDDTIKNYVKGGALIAAEIDRLLRINKKKDEVTPSFCGVCGKTVEEHSIE